MTHRDSAIGTRHSATAAGRVPSPDGRVPLAWRIGGRTLELSRPLVMGILNVTPDSFSDGGRFLSVERAVEHAGRMLEEGADIIDVGGESTRPQGATPVDAGEEVRRVVPVIERIRAVRPEAVLSVDTVKSEVARAALGVGAEIVNDVSALRLDGDMGRVCAEGRAGVILMHSRGGVSEMGTYAHARYGRDPVGEVIAELEERVGAARAAGIDDEQIVLDPGIGFAKRTEHSIRVLAELDRVTRLGFPVLVGVSRKRFIGELSGASEPGERGDGTLAANIVALERGARIFRVHDVRAARRGLDVAWAIERERQRVMES